MPLHRTLSPLLAFPLTVACWQTAAAEDISIEPPSINARGAAAIASSDCPADVNAVERHTPGKHLTPLSRALFIGGAAAAGVGLSYAGYRMIECGGLSCQSGQQRDKLDLASDIIGWGVGGLSLSLATILYLSSDDDDYEAAPIALDVGDDSLRVSFGGQF